VWRCVLLEPVAGGGGVAPVPLDLRVGAPAPTSSRGPFAPPPPPTPSNRLWLKAHPAFGRADISGCSGAVHGSPFLACEVLGCHAAVVGDLAGQVATKRLSGSRFGPFFSGVLPCYTQRDRRSSWWCGDWEAGGRASAAGRRVQARLSLDAVLLAPRNSSQKMSAPTVFSLTDAQAGSGFLPLETRVGSGLSPADTQTGSDSSPSISSSWKRRPACRTQAASLFSPAEVRAEAFSQPAPSPRQHNASSSPYANDGEKTLGAYILRLEFFGAGKNRIETEPSPNSSASR